MKFLLSGYYGYANAGDEAVLAAILDAVGERVPADTEFVVTSGNPAQTVALHNRDGHNVSAIPRQSPRPLLEAIRACDVFISGGGSLLQDATSVRNVVYYTSLMRMARLSRKPVTVYAHGVGPLRKPLSQKVARIAMQRASVITVRDPDSKALLQRIGVRRDIEVTADPVWALECRGDNGKVKRGQPLWCVSLRRWLNVENEEAYSAASFQAICGAARAAGARLRFLAMQPPSDGPLLDTYFAQFADKAQDEIIATENRHPREIMAEAGNCDVMLAMRLHALIFAAAQGIPCVAISYDPKVDSLARILGAPVLHSEDFNSNSGGAKVTTAVAQTEAPAKDALKDLKSKALYNADLATGLLKS